MIFGNHDDEGTALFLIRWTARILSIGIILLLAIFIFGDDGISSGSGIRRDEAIGLLFFPLGVAVGSIVGWKNEMLGGAISTASLVCFYLVFGLAITGKMPSGGWFALFNLPGFLFLTYGLLRTPIFRRSRTV